VLVEHFSIAAKLLSLRWMNENEWLEIFQKHDNFRTFSSTLLVVSGNNRIKI
jgi:hypothetical protein